MKLNDAVTARVTLEKMAGMEMSPKAALDFAEFVRNVMVEIQNFEIKRAELFRKYGEEAGEGEEKRLQIPTENEKKFNAAIKRGLSKDLKIEPYNIANLEIALTPTDLINALPMFK